MKITVSQKLFLGFSMLSLLTLAMGTSIFLGLNELTRHQKNLQMLHDFKLQIKTLESYNLHQHNNYLSDPARTFNGFTVDLAQAEEMAAVILADRDCPPFAADTHGDPPSCKTLLGNAMKYYRQAASEVIEKSQLAYQLNMENLALYEQMIEVATGLPQPLKSRSLYTIHDLELQKHKIADTNDPVFVKKMGESLKLILELNPPDTLTSLIKKFIINIEKAYFNRLAISNKQQFLSQNTENFQKIANTTFQGIERDSGKQQQRILYVIYALSCCSVILTLLFWYLTSRRLTTFLTNQKKAIFSIRAGEYDYPAKAVRDDEFGDLYRFTKKMALTLKEEITERALAESEKARLKDQLLQAQKLESIGLLAGGVAHDFNNLLTGITGYADLALAKLEKGHPIGKYLEIIIASGEKAGALTRQLLAFSRRQELAKKVVNINDLIENLLKMLTRVISEDIVLKFETTPDLTNTLADPAQIEQAIMNLAINARDAMPGGGLLKIGTSMVSLGESAVRQMNGADPGDFVRITVSDTGTGIPEKYRDKIFDPFFTTKGSEKGTGLGLATTFGTISQHNGFITVDSKPGKTVFNIFLPAVTEEIKDEKKSRNPAPFAPTGNETILLVDDNDTVREFAKEALEFCGYKLLVANDGKTALKILDHPDTEIDLLLTDVIMPGLNGKELADIILEKKPGIKVVFMSGYSDQIIDQETIAANPALAFLKKPLTAEILGHKVREVLDRN